MKRTMAVTQSTNPDAARAIPVVSLEVARPLAKQSSPAMKVAYGITL